MYFVVDILGQPMTQGSLRAMAAKGKNGYITDAEGKPKIITFHGRRGKDAERLESWRHEVAARAQCAYESALQGTGGHALGNLLDEPIGIGMLFQFPRPSGHWGTGRNKGLLKPSAPAVPGVRPDWDKLARAVCDALEGVIYTRDARISGGLVLKAYGPYCLTLAIWTIAGEDTEAIIADLVKRWSSRVPPKPWSTELFTRQRGG